MKRAAPPLSTQPTSPAGATSDMLSNPRHQDGQARPGGDRPAVQLPQEMLETIVRRTITGESPPVSARQLALLQRVDQGFRAAARSVLHSRDQQEVGRETARAQIERLARRSTPEEFTAGMRSIVRRAPDVGIRLRSLPDDLQETALQVLAEQTHLRSLDLDAKEAPRSVRGAVTAMQTILPRNPQLQHAGLNLAGCELANEDMNAIANSTSLKALTSLNVGNNAIGDEGVAALASSEHLRLRSLELRSNNISDRGVTTLANSEMARSLTSLGLRNNVTIGPQGVAALANSDKLAALTSLDLEGNLFFGDEGATALAHSRHLRLKSLDLGNGRIDEAGARALANGEIARSLTSLALPGNYLRNGGVCALADSDKLGNLTSLDLQDCRFNLEGARALANSVHLRSLTSLNIENNGICDAGAEALANSEELRSLTFLGAGYNYIGDWGARALAHSEIVQTLDTLDLRGNSIGNEGARAVANSDKLRAETLLDLRYNPISDDAARELRARFKHVAM
ncbi:hypothetical protein [Noviherbaspirillum sp.]|uniref:hypothetical protein n=1 Tax=Noviherbaspirillum sp. TaxID=1926288 RepID=UPI0025CFBD95|nr:hypothetical protein [Noviherbaspirillum sp.]